MLKKFLLAIAVAIPMLASAQVKFGTVDVESIIPTMPEFKAAQDQIAEASKKYEATYKGLQDELNKLYAEFQQLNNDPSTPQSIKDLRIQDIQDKDERSKQFLQTAQQDLERQNAQLMQPIQEKVVNAIKAVGAENGFTMIFPAGVSVYDSPDIIDVTPMVKTKLGIQ